MPDKKSSAGPGIGIWIALGILGVLLVIGLAGSGRREPKSPEVTGEAQPVTELPPAERAEEKTAPSQAVQQAPPVSKTSRALPPAITASKPPEPAALELGKNLAGTLRLDIPVLEVSGVEKRLPLAYTCYRSNISPPLQWQGAPKRTKSFAVFLERREKDMPPYLKWAVFNIPGSAKGLPENLPKQPDVFKDGTAQATSDQSAAVYVGPCEPQGKIEYVFRLFALDEVLKLPGGAPKDDLIRAMNGHIIDARDLAVIHYLRL